MTCLLSQRLSYFYDLLHVQWSVPTTKCQKHHYRLIMYQITLLQPFRSIFLYYIHVRATLPNTYSREMRMNGVGFNTLIKKASVPLFLSQLLFTDHNHIQFSYLQMKVLTDSLFMQHSSFIPECEDNLKPQMGMTFEGLKAAEEFYKSYSHHSGFGVRIGQQKKLENEVIHNKSYCTCLVMIPTRQYHGSSTSHCLVSPDKRHLIKSNR